MQKMIAYHGDQAVKEKYILRMKAHMAADELIRGTGWDNNKGCAVGCTLDMYDHSAYEVELGVPQQLAQLEDAIFEGLPLEDAMKFPLQFLEAINVGANLSLVWPKFAVWMLTDPVHGTIQYCAADGVEATKQIVALFNNTIAGLEESESARSAARSAAESAESAAWSAAWSAESAESAAWSAAWSAARSAWSAARSAAYQAQKDQLLFLISECK